MARKKQKKQYVIEEGIFSIYPDFPVLINDSVVINTEEKRLKLVAKKASVTNSDITLGVLANARLRISKYRQRELESVEEKVNYTYSKFKFNPITEFFKTFFSISRKYRFMTGFSGIFHLFYLQYKQVPCLFFPQHLQFCLCRLQ